MEDHSCSNPSTGREGNEEGYRSLPSGYVPYVPEEEVTYRSVEAYFPPQTASLRMGYPSSFNSTELSADDELFLRDYKGMSANKSNPSASVSSAIRSKLLPLTAPRRPESLLPTHFLSTESPIILMSHLKKCLRDCDVEFKVKDEKFKIKAYKRCAMKGCIVFEIRIYDASEVSDSSDDVALSAVEFRRTNGCSMAWNYMYRKFCASLHKVCNDAPNFDEDLAITNLLTPLVPSVEVIKDIIDLTTSSSSFLREEASQSMVSLSKLTLPSDILSIRVDGSIVPSDADEQDLCCSRKSAVVSAIIEIIKRGNDSECAPLAFMLESLTTDSRICKSLMNSDARFITFLEQCLQVDDAFRQRAAAATVSNFVKCSEKIADRRIPSLVLQMRSSKCPIVRNYGMDISLALNVVSP